MTTTTTSALTPSPGQPHSGVIVTGGASGIGLACAEALVAVGRPVALWDLDADKATALARDLAGRYDTPVCGLAIDLTRTDGIAAAVEASRTALGSIGGLVHAAGVSLPVPLDQLTEESWETVLRVNLRALPFVVQAIRADLKAQRGSAIVGIASINATLGNAANPAYSASKGGMLSLIRALADDLGQDGIRINAVSPGQILTPMLQPVVEALPQGQFEQRILLNRLGEPAEIGRAVRFLLSDEASYVTAAELVVDGGNISSQRM
ncbi:SDR family oxidoreductase [Aestuariicella hydrocarbonica]|uniref:SDR family oxidoreductase n=1 Tax=Pseudomaricurvus hydrocarbonicus TaxID=1470433 RepID=A0A9E5JVA2_9GAMM|nr:SDR family oxidoreductase [Aestuariicella hydrocarbonica]NHO66106.1 SDR family oxidoreductase [Aestuariicella hydrocarbonica]